MIKGSSQLGLTDVTDAQYNILMFYSFLPERNIVHSNNIIILFILLLPATFIPYENGLYTILDLHMSPVKFHHTNYGAQ